MRVDLKIMRNVLLVFFLLTMAGSAIADEYVVYVAKGYTYNELLKTLTGTQFAIKYDDEEKQFYLNTANIMTTGWIFLNDDDLKTLRANLAKYLQWEKTARQKGVEIQKVLPNSQITAKVGWKFGDDFYISNGLTVTFTFFSQSKTRHQLVIASNKVYSSGNQFITYKLDSLYLDRDQVVALSKGISPDRIKNAIKDHEKMKANESLFK